MQDRQRGWISVKIRSEEVSRQSERLIDMKNNYIKKTERPAGST